MRIYIAAPFFNAAQIAIVAAIEDLLRPHYEFYSPRLDSGSHLLSPEKRRDPAAWIPVLDSNINELDKCDLVIAVLQFAMPNNSKLAIMRSREEIDTFVGDVQEECFILKSDIELPDNGVVWECGYAFAKQKPIVGFHSSKHLSEMNLMLSHTCTGFISGFAQLGKFLNKTSGSKYGIHQGVNWQVAELSLQDTQVI